MSPETILWRERVHVTGVRDDASGYWVRLQASNAPTGTRPMECYKAGQVLIIETVFDMDRVPWAEGEDGQPTGKGGEKL